MKRVLVHRVVDYPTYKSEKEEVLEKQVREVWRRLTGAVGRLFSSDPSELIPKEWWDEILESADFNIDIYIDDEGTLESFLENIRTLVNNLVEATSNAQEFVKSLVQQIKEKEEKKTEEQQPLAPEERQALRKQEETQEGKQPESPLEMAKKTLSTLSSAEQSPPRLKIEVEIFAETSTSLITTQLPVDVGDIIKRCKEIGGGIISLLDRIFASSPENPQSVRDAQERLRTAQSQLRNLQRIINALIGKTFSNLEQQVISHLQKNTQIVNMMVSQISRHVIEKIGEKLENPEEMKETANIWEVLGRIGGRSELERFTEKARRALERGELPDDVRRNIQSLVQGGLIPALLGKVKGALKALQTALKVAEIISEITSWKPSGVSVPKEGEESPEESPREGKLSLTEIEGVINELVKLLEDLGEEINRRNTPEDKVRFTGFLRVLRVRLFGGMSGERTVFEMLSDLIKNPAIPFRNEIEKFIRENRSVLEQIKLNDLYRIGKDAYERLTEIEKGIEESSRGEGRRELHKQIKVKPPKKPKPIKKLPPLPKAVEQILLWWKNLPAESRKVISGILHSYLVETDPDVRKALERELVETAKRLGIPIKALRALEDLPD